MTQIDSFSFNEERECKLPRRGKKMALLRSLPIPNRLLVEKPMPIRVKVSECIYVLRPLFYCMMISLHDETSFKPLVFSLVADAVSFLLRVGYERRSIPESEELKQRSKNLLWAYLFRKPFYTAFTKPKIIEPLLNRLVKWEFLKNIIISSLDFKSTYSLSM